MRAWRYGRPDSGHDRCLGLRRDPVQNIHPRDRRQAASITADRVQRDSGGERRRQDCDDDAPCPCECGAGQQAVSDLLSGNVERTAVPENGDE